MSFERAVALVLANEGGMANVPGDKGGVTKFGISRAAHPGIDFATLTREGAIAIYHAQYWDKIHGDELPEPLDCVMMDWAVHAGPRAAIRRLQGILAFQPEDQDGRMGPQTLGGVKAIETAKLVRACLMERAADLVHQGANADQRVFLIGWVRRLIAVALEVGSG